MPSKMSYNMSINELPYQGKTQDSRSDSEDSNEELSEDESTIEEEVVIKTKDE